MALKQKLLSISLAASTLLGVGLTAQEKEPQKQPVPAAQTIPAAGEALTSEQQAAMLKRLTGFRRRMERSCKMEILKMERAEARKVTQAKRAYQSAVQKAHRAAAKGALSATDEVVLQANIDRARENVELYEKTIDETVKQQAADIQKRYDEELKEINQMIRDVEKGKMPSVKRLEKKQETGAFQNKGKEQIKNAAEKHQRAVYNER